MSGNEHITQEELASYAMQNLPVAESASMGTHLQECAACRAELAQVYGDLSLLGLSVEQVAVPVGARERFLARISTEEPAKPAAAVTEITAKSKRGGASVWVPWSIAAGLTIATVSLGVQNRALNDELRGESTLVTNLALQASHAQQVLEVLTAPQAQRVTLTEGKAPVQPTARATYLPERGAMILLATNLKPLPASKTYELWIIPTNGAPVPAGLFHPDEAGSATLVLPALHAGIAAKAFAVTVENASGATSPTMPIVLSGATGS